MKEKTIFKPYKDKKFQTHYWDGLVRTVPRWKLWCVKLFLARHKWEIKMDEVKVVGYEFRGTLYVDKILGIQH